MSEKIYTYFANDGAGPYRFVATGEYRIPQYNEWFVAESGFAQKHGPWATSFERVILRPFEQIYTRGDKKYVSTGTRRLLQEGDFWLSDPGGVVCGPARCVTSKLSLLREILREYVEPLTPPTPPAKYEATGEWRVPRVGEFYIARGWYVTTPGYIVKAQSERETGNQPCRIVREIDDVVKGVTSPATNVARKVAETAVSKTYRYDGKLFVESGEFRKLSKGDYWLSPAGDVWGEWTDFMSSNAARSILIEAFPPLSGFEHLAPEGQLFVRTGEKRRARRGEWVKDSRDWNAEVGASQWASEESVIECDVLKPFGVTVPDGWESTGEWRVVQKGEYWLRSKMDGSPDNPPYLCGPCEGNCETPLKRWILRRTVSNKNCICSRGWSEQCDCGETAQKYAPQVSSFDPRSCYNTPAKTPAFPGQHPCDTSNVAPKISDKYVLTGEFRPPQEGEYYVGEDRRSYVLSAKSCRPPDSRYIVRLRVAPQEVLSSANFSWAARLIQQETPWVRQDEAERKLREVGASVAALRLLLEEASRRSIEDDKKQVEFKEKVKKLENDVKSWQGQCAAVRKERDSYRADSLRNYGLYNDLKEKVKKAVQG